MKLIDRLEKYLYIKCIRKFRTQQDIADFLGVAEKTVRNRLKKYQIAYTRRENNKPKQYYVMAKRYPNK